MHKYPNRYKHKRGIKYRLYSVESIEDKFDAEIISLGDIPWPMVKNLCIPGASGAIVLLYANQIRFFRSVTTRVLWLSFRSTALFSTSYTHFIFSPLYFHYSRLFLFHNAL